MEQNTAVKAKIFKALADEKRLAILEFLKSGEKCACNIMDHMEIGQSAVSYHMKILCDSNIVESWQVGKWTHYQISKAGSRDTIEMLAELTNVNEDIDMSCACNK